MKEKEMMVQGIIRRLNQQAFKEGLVTGEGERGILDTLDSFTSTGSTEKGIWEKRLVLDQMSLRFLGVPFWVQKLDYILNFRSSGTMSV